MIHLNTRRAAQVRTKGHADALGRSVILEVQDKDAAPERYALSTADALTISAGLLRGIISAYIFATVRLFHARRHS